jgi:hypothetical protein
MKNLYKYLIIIIFSFLIFYWIQIIDDKKYKITRNSLYEKYKNRLLISSIIGLILNLNIAEHNNISEIIISTTGPMEPMENIEFNNSNIFNKDDFISFPPPF